MRIGFIFIEKYPNFDLDGQLLSIMSTEERYPLDTYVRTGLWGATQTGAKTIADLKLAVLNNVSSRKSTEDTRLRNTNESNDQ